jgi:hypothetical protein
VPQQTWPCGQSATLAQLTGVPVQVALAAWHDDMNL